MSRPRRALIGASVIGAIGAIVVWCALRPASAPTGAPAPAAAEPPRDEALPGGGPPGRDMAAPPLSPVEHARPPLAAGPSEATPMVVQLVLQAGDDGWRVVGRQEMPGAIAARRAVRGDTHLAVVVDEAGAEVARVPVMLGSHLRGDARDERGELIAITGPPATELVVRYTCRAPDARMRLHALPPVDETDAADLPLAQPVATFAVR